MSFSIGIIGLPNVGKSTLFKALTKKQVDIANFPFTTISPNIGMVKVPDQRLEKLADVLKPQKVIPTYIEFVDIAGLVKGAHRGEGLGNQFLARIREVEAIVEVIRRFENPDIVHPTGKIDPQIDLEVINLELALADLAHLEKFLEKIKKEAKSGEKEAIKKMPILEKLKKNLNQGIPAREAIQDPEEKKVISDLNLLTIKPIIYLINLDEQQIKEKPKPFSLKAHFSPVFLCAKLEAELADLPESEIQEYLKEYGLERSGLDELILTAYQILDLITFFTCQNQILQAWTIEKGAKAPQAACKVHTDFEKNFIRAEVINWQDLVNCQSEQVAREKGLLRVEGKEYVAQDGDVIHFRSGT